MNDSESPIKSPVLLSEGKVESLSDFVNLTFEYAIFFRWIYFKNRPRGNLLLVRALLVVGMLASLFYFFFHDFGLVLEGIEIDPIIAFTAGVALAYWDMIKVFHWKSEACGTIHLEMIKEGGQGRTQTARTLSNSLSIELLTLDMWAHRKYRQLFSRNLHRAVEHAYSKNSKKIEGMTLPEKIGDLYKKINAGHLQAKEARLLLDNYQEYLMYQTNLHFEGKSAA
jgi:hypothetical protein